MPRLRDAQEVVALEPKNSYAHEARCGLLARSLQLYPASGECEAAIEVTKRDSLHQAELQREVEDAKKVMRSIRAATNLSNP